MSKNKSVFNRIFLPILLLGFIISFLFTAFAYRSITRKTRLEADQANRLSANVIQSQIERDMSLIENTMTSFSSTTSFNDLVSEPLTASDLTKYKETVKQISYLESLIDHYTIYFELISLEGNWKIKNSSLTQLDKEEKQTYIEFYIQNPDYLVNRWTNYNDTLIYTTVLPNFTERKNAVFQGGFHTNDLTRTLSNENMADYLLFDKNDYLLYSKSDTENDYSTLLDEIKQTKSNQGIISLDNQQYFFNISKLDQRLYVMVIEPNKSGFTILVRTVLGTATVFIVIMLSIIYIGYRIATNISVPIKDLNQRLQHDGDKIALDDLNYLAENIDSLIKQKSYFELQLEAGIPSLREQFSRSILYRQLSDQSIHDKLERLNYNLPDNPVYLVVLIQIEYRNDLSDLNSDVWIFGVNQLLKEIFYNNDQILTPIILDSTSQASIFVFDESDYSETTLINMLNALVQNIFELLKIRVSIGVSYPYSRLNESKLALQEAERALTHRKNFSESVIITASDIRDLNNEPMLTFYPSDDETEILESITIGDAERAHHFLNIFIDNLHNYATNASTIELSQIRLINNLFMLSQQLKLSIDVQNSQDESIYYRIIHNQNLNYFKSIVYNEIILPMTDEVTQKTEESFKNISEEIISIIHERYDVELTLESIADELHYNPNYLSNIFRKEVGLSFTEYLNNFRLAKAKELLIETDMPIKDIASKLKYTNSQNFIRFFKRHEDLTPGQYRTKYRNN